MWPRAKGWMEHLLSSLSFWPAFPALLLWKSIAFQWPRLEKITRFFALRRDGHFVIPLMSSLSIQINDLG
ncbi:hypothetical protein DUT91_00970 [Phyllobacterium salinisoli]|uniref:Uncharacterized protein n=2 Tax=Phyllobacterium salinisoli TaxID=1899321 RepID=A0A368KAH5_9HYPH|nr:hypothetical protein DUT91_00970 [Phyllobacterium salinisoli]